MKSCGKSKPLLPTTWVISGGVGLILLFLLISGIRSYYSKSSSDSSSSNDQGSSQNQNSSGQSGGATKPAYSYPEKGKAYATTQQPVKAHLDNEVMRLKSWGDGIVIKQNGNTICSQKNGKNPECWMTLPKGDYEIFSLNGKTLVEWGIP
jgi:hypothetical protein